jgi:hypothetical protein
MQTQIKTQNEKLKFLKCFLDYLHENCFSDSEGWYYKSSDDYTEPIPIDQLLNDFIVYENKKNLNFC